MINPFTGIPSVRPAARPSFPAVFRGGRLVRMRDGIDILLLGVTKKVYHKDAYSRRVAPCELGLLRRKYAE